MTNGKAPGDDHYHPLTSRGEPETLRKQSIEDEEMRLRSSTKSDRCDREDMRMIMEPPLKEG